MKRKNGETVEVEEFFEVNIVSQDQRCSTPDCGNLACWCLQAPFCFDCFVRNNPDKDLEGLDSINHLCMHHEGPHSGEPVRGKLLHFDGR